jgi:hypothetical protein
MTAVAFVCAIIGWCLFLVAPNQSELASVGAVIFFLSAIHLISVTTILLWKFMP